MKKRILGPLLSFAAFLLVGAGCWTTTVNVNTNVAIQNANTNAVVENTVTLTINSGSGDPKVFTHEREDGMTALALLEHLQEEGEITVSTKHYDFGDLVDGIDGVNATDSVFWSFYVNDTLASVGAGDYALQAGDRIEFRYENM